MGKKRGPKCCVTAGIDHDDTRKVLAAGFDEAPYAQKARWLLGATQHRH